MLFVLGIITGVLLTIALVIGEVIFSHHIKRKTGKEDLTEVVLDLFKEKEGSIIFPVDIGVKKRERLLSENEQKGIDTSLEELL